MRKQKAIWDTEHKETNSLPSMASIDPSSGVVAFIDFLKQKNATGDKKAIDIGCGKGRNTIYLAKQGYEVFAVDYIQRALNVANKFAVNEKMSNSIHFKNIEIDKKWPFKDNFFDIAIDCFSSIDIETRNGRITYRDEMFRTLKPNGFALVMVVSADDEWEKKLIHDSPSREKNSTIWPQNGKFQKDYDENELREFYSEFEIDRLEKIKKKTFKLGKGYTATNYWLVLKKH